VSSETPAAHLARLKLTYPSWSIRAIEPFEGTVYPAHRREEHLAPNFVYALNLGELEAALMDCAAGQVVVSLPRPGPGRWKPARPAVTLHGWL